MMRIQDSLRYLSASGRERVGSGENMNLGGKQGSNHGMPRVHY